MIEWDGRWRLRGDVDVDVALVVEVVVEGDVGCGVLADMDFLVGVEAVAGAEGGEDRGWGGEGAGKGELEGRGLGKEVG